SAEEILCGEATSSIVRVDVGRTELNIVGNLQCLIGDVALSTNIPSLLGRVVVKGLFGESSMFALGEL
ncbi:8479_t:CDS:2, partial [Ambispora gerdemannii]